jgi:hypothetical protein
LKISTDIFRKVTVGFFEKIGKNGYLLRLTASVTLN